MDISFVSGQDKYNYRVCAIILSGNKILAMHDERSPYYYLPGGRVRMGETPRHAVIREVVEELNIKAKIVRPQNRELSGGNARRGRRPRRPAGIRERYIRGVGDAAPYGETNPNLKTTIS